SSFLGDRNRKFKLHLIVAHGGRDGAVLLKPVFCHCHQFRRVGALIPVAEGQVGEDLPGFFHRDPGQNEGVGHVAVRIPVAGETVIVIAASHLAQNLLLPVHIVIFGLCFALADQFLQNRLAVLDGGGEHLLPVLRYRFEVKFVAVRVMLRVSVHHQTLQQCFVIRLDEHRYKSLFDTFPFGIAVRRHDGVIICHGWEIGALAVQILHQSIRH
ncbi:Stage II sporulation protein M, partial [Dysosmobacter welbionis]